MSHINGAEPERAFPQDLAAFKRWQAAQRAALRAKHLPPTEQDVHERVIADLARDAGISVEEYHRQKAGRA